MKGAHPPSSPQSSVNQASFAGKFSENELRAEKLLPMIVDYSIEFTSAIHNDIHRSVVFEGGKLVGNIILKPSSNVFDTSFALKYQQQVQQNPNLIIDRDLSSPLSAPFASSNISSNSNNSNSAFGSTNNTIPIADQLLYGYLFTTFANIFDIKPDKSQDAQADDMYLPSNNLILLDEKQRESLLFKSKKVWRELFSKLHIKTYISSRFPESVRSSTPSTPGGSSSSATSIEINYFDNSKEFIDFYLFKSNFVAKQAVNTQSVFMELTCNEIELLDQDSTDFRVTFPFSIDVPLNDSNRNPYFVISEIFIPSDQFTDSMVRSLADAKSPSFKVNNFDLDFLVSYETSLQYIPSRIFLCALCKPIVLRKSIKLQSKTKLLNMKNYIQLVLENTCENQSLKIEKVELNLTNARFFNYLPPGEAQKLMIVNEREEKVPNDSDETTTTNYLLSPPPSTIYDLFDCFIEKSQFPIELKPFEQYTLNLLITPIYRNMDEIIDKLQNKKSIVNLFMNNSSVTASIPFNSNGTLENQSSNNSIVWDDSLAQYKSKVDITYTIKNQEDEGKTSTFKSFMEVPWVAILKRGLFASIKCDKQSVALMAPFTISIFLSNFSDSECDLILSSQPTAESSIICQDAQIDVGIVKPSQSTKVVLHYIGVQQGLHHMDLLCIYNKKTQQQFIFPFYIQVIITK
ncbi:predicted protein [Naegleria gruberi]|uniref:Predicted protein n=1 Tax=Naegleria gruberi TaxID=5762 RepID=D2VAH2_NAEGR|nr:uncharacterized protein NAEGRDRAFT_65858 [Naegleria gruberi]EFC46072.1 predicted protein [Naegleria gruberi]|eukprot:XP_002678816.1 predicted protein [Naegleria gruberi strain NEG-M]